MFIRPGSTQQYSYQVFFMKKLWMNTVPGRDRNADLIFHFHQEVDMDHDKKMIIVKDDYCGKDDLNNIGCLQVPKFLRGWHSIDAKQAASLSALLYRTR